MNEIIEKIIYETHDKWKYESRINNKQYFLRFLNKMMDKDPKTETTLQFILSQDGLIIMIGVMNILREMNNKAYVDTVKEMSIHLKRKEQ